MKIISRAQNCEAFTYSLFFERKDCKGAGFAFDCDKDGNLLPMSEQKRASLDACLASGDYRESEVITWHNRWREPAVGLCECGEEVYLDGFTNTCSGCGRDYNSAGQELAPREQWGEDTGESLADILSIP